MLFESGDPWGSSWVYEARGCSYGIVHRLKSIGSTYVAIRRDAVVDTPCATVPAADRVIVQDEACFELGGPMQYWRTDQAGWNGSLKWTHATDTQVYNYALWHLDLDQAGRYVLEAYTPAAWAESHQANYQVRHGGVTTATVVDQTAVDGWVTVGELDFAAGDGQWVRLEDLTGESDGSQTRVVADALRITWVDQATPYGQNLGEKDRDRLGKFTGGCNASNAPSRGAPPTVVLGCMLLLLWLVRRTRRR